jgi:hypothetical protein
LAALVLVRLLSQAGGFDMLVFSCDTPCEESKGGDCAPGCEDCLCCPHHRVMTLNNVPETWLIDPAPTDFAAVTTPVQDPRAHEIFHIPKRSASV